MFIHASHSERAALSKRTAFLVFVFLCTPQKYVFALSEAPFPTFIQPLSLEGKTAAWLQDIGKE